MMVPRAIARRIVTPIALATVVAMTWQPAARADLRETSTPQVDTEEPADVRPPARAQQAPDQTPPGAPAPGATSGDEATTPGTSAESTLEAESASAVARPRHASSLYAWGVGARARWVSVPGWLLGLFTEHNHPLLSFGHFGVEAFRRGGNFDLAVAFAYQNMSPPDGNWLGNGHDPVDTKYLQFRGLSLYSADISFIWHNMFTSWFGVHAGAGLGVAIVRGDLFLFPSEGCNETNLDDTSMCKPLVFTCTNGVCSSPQGLPRSPDKDVLPLVPIVNIVFGVDFRLPNVKGWEAKLEAGFYDAFFGGFGVAYTF